MAKDDDRIDKLHLIKRNPELPTMMHSRIQEGWTNTSKLTSIQAIQTLISKIQMLSVCALFHVHDTPKAKLRTKAFHPAFPHYFTVRYY